MEVAQANFETQADIIAKDVDDQDFGKPEVQEALRDAGINNYFSSTQNFLGWLRSQ